MPIVRDKSRGTYVFEFDRVINGGRVRIRKRLPKAWTAAQADEFERKESAKLYATANGLGVEDRLIDDAVAVYVAERVPISSFVRRQCRCRKLLIYMVLSECGSRIL